MTKKQFWLIGAWSLIALSACSSKPKDGLTDTYTSGVIAITADESFQPIVQRKLMCSRDCFLWPELFPVILLR